MVPVSERRGSSLPGTALLLAALSLALLVAADEPRPQHSTSLSPQGGSGVELDSEELAEIALERTPAVARRVEAIRELRFERVPQPRLADTDYLRRLTERELSRPKLARELRADEAGLRLLGLIEPGAKIESIASDFTALAAAFYDPGAKRLFVVSDAVPAGPALVEFVLSHELTHALEDQRFGLPRSNGPASDERALAQSALVEGTASALMTEYAGRHLSALDLASDAAGIVEPQTELPQFLEAQAMFSYIRGQEFVEDLYARTQSWALVDRAFTERPPRTSEQILHPVTYMLDERALVVPAAPSPGRGWRELDEDLVGEFLTAQVLQLAEGPVPASASEGWGGDRYQLWAPPGAGQCEAACRSGSALAIGWRWDSPADLREFGEALVEYVETGLGGEERGPGSWQLDGGWGHVGVDAGVARLGLGPTAALARRLAGG